jgi:hypothetical protein
MSAIVTALAIQAGKKAGEFLIEKYGDDALRAFTEWIEKRRHGAPHPSAIEAESDAALSALEIGIKEALIELDRPFEDFFGPRVGESPNAPPSVEVPYGEKVTGFHPMEQNWGGMLLVGDVIWQDGQQALWIVKRYDDPTRNDAPVGDLSEWHPDDRQPMQ